MAAAWMDGLNDAQRQAVLHDQGPLLIIAGAGTGKTKTLASRVASLIDRGTDPQRILLLTFTRRSAADMIERAGRAIGQNIGQRVWGGTFHAVGNRLLRQHARAIGLSETFTVMDQGDAGDLMNIVRTSLGLHNSGQRFPRKDTLVAIYSRTVSSQTRLAAILESHFPWCAPHQEGIRDIFALYTRKKRERQVLDYDDLLLYWRALLEAPSVGDHVGRLFDHILVDEYQDTNLVQGQILKLMRRHIRNITVVGDDAQSIYSFRAATVENILNFPEQFDQTTQVTLEENYRSTQPILDVANAVIAQASRQYPKHLSAVRAGEARPELVTCADEAQQCQAVCMRVLERLEQGTPLRNQAVLFRASHHSDQLEIELGRRRIPFVKFGGLVFVEAAHVKDMVAVLRVLENPLDELAWHRLLLLLDGIGPATAKAIVDTLLEGDRAGAAASPMHRLLHDPPPVPPAAAQQMVDLRRVLGECLEPELPPAGQVQRIRQFYEPIFEKRYDNAPLRLRDLEQLEQIAGNYTTRQQFLTDLSLDPPTRTQDLAGPPLLEEDYLILSTIHSAKGGEWDAVHVLHAADGMIPSDMATGDQAQIEEERRLFYVALTRARDHLALYFPLRYYFRKTSDRHSYAQLTRFLPPQMHAMLDRTTAEGDPATGPESGAMTPCVADAAETVADILGKLWD